MYWQDGVRTKPKSALKKLEDMKPGMYVLCYTLPGQEKVGVIRRQPEKEEQK